MRSNLNEKKILLVDDEADIRDFLRWEFEDRGAVVYEAGSIGEGREIFTSKSPDFSIFDIRMPGGTGVDLLVDCKAIRPELPISLMTGFTEVALNKIYNKGACDVFVKPLKYEILFPRVDKEILPLEQKFDHIKHSSEIVDELDFDFDLGYGIDEQQIYLGYGGVSVRVANGTFSEINACYRLRFSGDEVICRLCWVDTLNSGGKSLGFEFIEFSGEALRQSMIEKIKSSNPLSYIPMFKV